MTGGRRRPNKRGSRIGTDSIPRRLRALGFATYREYLASAHWAQVRAQFFARTIKRCCRVCGCIERLALHHRTYRRLGREQMGDLILLCGDCHREVHSLPGQSLWINTEYLIRKRGRPAVVVPVWSVTYGPDNGERPPWE